MPRPWPPRCLTRPRSETQRKAELEWESLKKIWLDRGTELAKNGGIIVSENEITFSEEFGHYLFFLKEHASPCDYVLTSREMEKRIFVGKYNINQCYGSIFNAYQDKPLERVRMDLWFNNYMCNVVRGGWNMKLILSEDKKSILKKVDIYSNGKYTLSQTIVVYGNIGGDLNLSEPLEITFKNVDSVKQEI